MLDAEFRILNRDALSFQSKIFPLLFGETLSGFGRYINFIVNFDKTGGPIAAAFNN